MKIKNYWKGVADVYSVGERLQTMINVKYQGSKNGVNWKIRKETINRIIGSCKFYQSTKDILRNEYKTHTCTHIIIIIYLLVKTPLICI